MGLIYLIPVALALGAVGLGAFLWSLKSGQYDDLDGAAERILFNDSDSPIVETSQKESKAGPVQVESISDSESRGRRK